MNRPDFRGEYPEGWAELATDVKVRAGWRCIRCHHPDHPATCRRLGVPRGTLPCDEQCAHPRLGDGLRRVLTVHHFDGDKGNTRWWNLLALCQVCHLEFQAKVNPHATYLWPHREWLRPYVAGYYAHALLGLDLTILEVEGRLEELLRAGQPHLDNVMEGGG